MNNSIGFYDEVARIGAEMLEILSAADKTKDDVRTYLNLVADIYNKLVKVHDKVATVAINVTLTTTLSEARQHLQKMELHLKEAFGTEELCSVFKNLGQNLRPLKEDLGLSSDDRQIWDDFCESLEKEEQGVAMLYVNKLSDLHNLGYTDLSLESLKQKVLDILDQLVIQKARFDLLAKRAEGMGKQIE